MSYFSRLTDIVTCNLSAILSREADPPEALKRIIGEMEEGLAGARRSAATAEASERRIQQEIDEHRAQADRWRSAAKEELQAGREDQARLALLRKQEVEDVIAGLNQQHQAAVATREHLSTTLRAIEARLADAHRRLQEFETGRPIEAAPVRVPSAGAVSAVAAIDDDRSRRIESELEALKRELGRNA